MTATDESVTTRRPLPAMLLSAVVGLVLGYIALQAVNQGIHLVWDVVPERWGGAPAWYVIGVLVLAALLVYVIRRFVGDEGHSPIGGIQVTPLTARDYVGVILAILATLWGGIVLGPEVALVATGSMVGTVFARAMGVTGGKDVTKVVGLGALGAILALLVNPLLSGSAEIGNAPTAIEVEQLGWAIVVGVIATITVGLARAVASLIARAAGTAPHLPILVGAALIVAVSALAMHAITGLDVLYIVTSGEEMITTLPTVTSISAVVAILVFKTIAYAVSLGAGYRGGPFFPAMFVGATSGLLVALVIAEFSTHGPSVPAALVVGVVAATIASVKMSWRVAILLAVVIGLFMGTWTLVPAALVGAIVARAIPRWSDRLAPPAHAA